MKVYYQVWLTNCEDKKRKLESNISMPRVLNVCESLPHFKRCFGKAF